MAQRKRQLHIHHQGMVIQTAPAKTKTNMKTQHLTKTVLLLAIVALHPIASVQGESAGKPAVEKKEIAPGSLSTVIGDSATFSTLAKALKATGLDATLGGTDQFTVFAPTDEAFAKLPADTLTKLMLPSNVEKLRMLLLYHVVAGKVMAADLKDGDVKTVNGEKIEVKVSSDKIEVNGDKVYSADVAATNGVMHSIGKVMVPKSLDGFVGLKD
jgi:uncharacterized surface protein with fasciclin (FAS1) repeats